MEEERRLAYVAITRAKEELYILNADYRMLYGNSQRNVPSRFLDEIPGGIVDRSHAKAWKKPEPGMSLPVSSKEARAVTTEAARNFGPVKIDIKHPPAENFSTGDSVIHKTFGSGVILSAEKMGNDSLLEIAFDKVGTKKLMANFARLKKQ
jgi:DNA helicase-2/ATP-dependent DNA helicase PcrA